MGSVRFDKELHAGVKGYCLKLWNCQKVATNRCSGYLEVGQLVISLKYKTIDRQCQNT